MVTHPLIKQLRRAINKHTGAQIGLDWLGSHQPEDREEINKQARAAKRNLDRAIQQVNTYLMHGDVAIGKIRRESL